MGNEGKLVWIHFLDLPNFVGNVLARSNSSRNSLESVLNIMSQPFGPGLGCWPERERFQMAGNTAFALAEEGDHMDYIGVIRNYNPGDVVEPDLIPGLGKLCLQ